jgi:hypothetical protein
MERLFRQKTLTTKFLSELAALNTIQTIFKAFAIAAIHRKPAVNCDLNNQ